MRSTIASNGVYHPLTGKLGRTDAEQREADAERARQTQADAAKNLVLFARGPEDYLELADMLGLTEVIPEEVLADLRDAS